MSVTAEQTSQAIPPLTAWTVVSGAWTEAGGGLESTGGPQDVVLHSPPLTLAGPRLYTFNLTGDVAEGGGLTFGLQDEAMGTWLQQATVRGAGPRTWRIQARIRRPGTYHLVIADAREPGATRTRVVDLELASNAAEPDAAFDDEHWKDEAKRQWNVDHCGHDRGGGHDKGSLDYFLSVERDRYGSYAPWMPEAIGFDRYAGKRLIEIGGGLGTDLAQFAKGGARITDFDLAEGHLELARRNFEVRGLEGEFMLGDGEMIDLPDGSFDVVYSFGVIHHTPDTQAVVDHMHRLLRPGGEAIVMVYAKHSWNYWANVVYRQWFRQGLRKTMSIDDVLSAYTECSPNGARPLVKVYTARQCRHLFRAFSEVRVRKYQLTAGEVPPILRRLTSVERWGRFMGWNLLINAIK